MARRLTAISTFSGAFAGWEKGFGLAGIRTVAAVEADGWRRAQFHRQYPTVRLYQDVRNVSAATLRRDGNLADARHLARLYCPGLDVSDDLLGKMVSAVNGSVRRLCTGLDAVRELAANTGRTAFGPGDVPAALISKGAN